MRNAAIVMAAAVAVGGISLAPVFAATGALTTNPAQMQVSRNLAEKAAPEATLTAPNSQIQGVIDEATDYSLTPRHMSKLVSLFAHAQRQSIEKSATFSQGYGDKLNAQIESLSKTWKQKYGSDFDIAKAHVFSHTFSSIQFQPGTNAKMESATFDFQGPSGATRLQVPLVRETSGDWAINVPTSLTAEKLRDNLCAQLTEVNQRSAHWPKDESAAYRIITHHVLAAILDQPVQSHTQASAAPQSGSKVAQQSQTASVRPVATTSTYHWYQFWKW